MCAAWRQSGLLRASRLPNARRSRTLDRRVASWEATPHSNAKERAVLRVGLVGWRGMVGSVLMDRMRQCNDFDGVEPTFFSTSDAGGKGPTIAGKSTARYTMRYDLQPAWAAGRADLLPGRSVHDRCSRSSTPERLRRLLHRCGVDAAHGARCGTRARPGQHGRHQARACGRSQDVRRGELHGESDVDGPARPVQGRARRVVDLDDVSGRIGRRRQSHARTGGADVRRSPPAARLQLADPASECARVGPARHRSPARQTTLPTEQFARRSRPV